jgi:ABC-type microcin C transport system duplicated ATPase subunit YejF
VYFPIRQGLLKRTIGYVKAVDGISFELAAGRTLALVGESGCGKTTTGKALLQLLRDSARIEGEARLDGEPLDRLDGDELHQARRKMQIIFQDPFSSLNPRMRARLRGLEVAQRLAALLRAAGPQFCNAHALRRSRRSPAASNLCLRSRTGVNEKQQRRAIALRVSCQR